MNEHLAHTLCISILTSSMFILAIVLLRALFHRKIRMRLQYALWLLVAVRLLVLPVPLFASPLSVLRIPDIWQTPPEPPGMERIWDGFEQSTDETIPSAPYGQRLLPSALPVTEHSAEEARTDTSVVPLLAAAAAAGSVIIFLYLCIGNLRFAAFLRRRRIRFQIDGRQIYAGPGAGLQHFPTAPVKGRQRLPVYLVEGMPTPCLYGRAVYITAAMAENRQKLSHILTHEYCHYRQGDTLWAVVRCLCVTLYWWNPLVWLAASLSRQDCELSCDEAALRLLGSGERLSYGKTLIELIPVRKNGHSHCSIATTMSEGGRSMKNRIRQITANSRAAGSLCVLLAALALICFVSMSTTASALPKDSSTAAESDRAENTEDTEDMAFVLPEPTSAYTMQVDEDSDYFDLPTLYLNEEEQTFSFHINLFSSYLIAGTYKLEEDKLIACTLDGNHKYQFRFEDAKTLIYLDGPVSSAVGVPPAADPKIVPGSRFCLTDMSNSEDGSQQNAPGTEDRGTQNAPGTEDRGTQNVPGAEVHSTENAPDTDGIGSRTGAETGASPQDENTSQAVHDLDQAVGLAVLSFNQGRYLEAECPAEGHILLGQDAGENGETAAYSLTMYGEYQFQDDSFIKESGCGVIPAVITFSYDAHDGYLPIAYDLPEDGSFYTESIHRLFPKSLWDACISPAEQAVEALTKQEQAYAERYLQQLGRDAVIGNYGDFPHTLLTDAGVSVEVSNLMCEYEKYDGLWKYPDWIGRLERVENGVRYVYAMSLDHTAHEIVYTKSVYQTDNVVEMHVFDSLTGEKKQ